MHVCGIAVVCLVMLLCESSVYNATEQVWEGDAVPVAIINNGGNVGPPVWALKLRKVSNGAEILDAKSTASFANSHPVLYHCRVTYFSTSCTPKL